MTQRASINVLTFGCRLNIAESEVMRRVAAEAGVGEAVLVNTCAVTGEALRQARQAIRRAARERPSAQIIISGCGAQIEPQTFAAMPEVSRVLGNAEKLDAANYRAEAPRIAVGDIMAAREVVPHRLDAIAGHTRAFLQIQNGCDHRCTFCTIPFGRGNARSMPVEMALSEVRRLVATGHREIVLTGVDITSWGQDLPDRPRLGKLLRAVLRAAPELARLRLSSIDSIEADDDLFGVIADESRFMPHLHLSLQAGDDLILKRMKRRHARADALAFCDKARRLRPEMVFGADIIAGFPTETEDMFTRSLALIEDCGLTHVHAFPFSPRPGTPAARMPQVSGEVVRERAAKLRAAGQAALQDHLVRQVGRTLRVLSERGGKGRAEDFTPVATPGLEPGQIIAVTVTGHDGTLLQAAPISAAA